MPTRKRAQIAPDALLHQPDDGLTPSPGLPLSESPPESPWVKAIFDGAKDDPELFAFVQEEGATPCSALFAAVQTRAAEEGGQLFAAPGQRDPFAPAYPAGLGAGPMPLSEPTPYPLDAPAGPGARQRLEPITRDFQVNPWVKEPRVYEVSVQPDELARLKDAQTQVDLQSLADARHANSNAERIRDWQQIYASAPINKQRTRIVALDDKGKTEGIPNIALTRGCDRAHVTMERIANGLLPPETRVEACYDGFCFANKQHNNIYSNFTAMEHRSLERVDPAYIDKLLKDKKLRQALQEAPSIRHGKHGDDRHRDGDHGGAQRALDRPVRPCTVKRDGDATARPPHALSLTLFHSPPTELSLGRLRRRIGQRKRRIGTPTADGGHWNKVACPARVSTAHPRHPWKPPAAFPPTGDRSRSANQSPTGLHRRPGRPWRGASSGRG